MVLWIFYYRRHQGVDGECEGIGDFGMNLFESSFGVPSRALLVVGIRWV